SQASLMGTGRALVETGAVLIVERTSKLRERLARLDPGGDPLAHAAYASGVVGALAAASVEWMLAGTDRGRLTPYVERALVGLPRPSQDRAGGEAEPGLEPVDAPTRRPRNTR
ncbi:MAG: hypothetical protein ACTH31_14590, partial [Pseudoclavibacter sp.]